jgi:hypothetical protein
MADGAANGRSGLEYMLCSFGNRRCLTMAAVDIFLLLMLLLS